MHLRRPRAWFLLALSASLLAACGAGLWLSPLGAVPLRTLAHARWQTQRLNHYRMTVQFSRGGIERESWTLEVRGERLIGGYDTISGAALTASQLRRAEPFLPVDALFEAIDEEIKAPPISSLFSLQTHIARLSRPLRARLNPCAVRMPSIDYDPQLGYPRNVLVHDSPCFPGHTWTVFISELTRLP